MTIPAAASPAAAWSENERTEVRRLPIGAVVSGRYKIERVLGSGGFAVVYQAYDPVIDRRVALKVLELHHHTRDATLHQKLLVQFRQEAQSAARIKHPNVVTIHDMGVTEKSEQPFIIMELLEGHDLGAELERFGPLHPTRAIPLFIKALQALGVGHRMEVVHKDLKPGNVFLTSPHTESEDVRVVDFGIARLGTEAAQIYGPDVVVGTPRYIAPELLRQQVATPAVDVYQMALILGECLSGNPLVPDDDVEVCTGRHLRGEVFVPMHLQSTELDAILHKALSRNPEDRFADATGFCRALEAVDVTGIPAAIWDPSALLARSEQTTTGISTRDTLVQTGPTFVDAGAANVSIMLRTPWRVGGALDPPTAVPASAALAAVHAEPAADASSWTGVLAVPGEPTREPSREPTRPPRTAAGPWIVTGLAVAFAVFMAALLATAILLWPQTPALAPAVQVPVHIPVPATAAVPDPEPVADPDPDPRADEAEPPAKPEASAPVAVEPAPQPKAQEARPARTRRPRPAAKTKRPAPDRRRGLIPD